MKYTITCRAELATARWSGGTTTQLAIWPPEASYAARNFTWRASSATIEDEESEFTPLPGYTRILMVLDGALTLTHGSGDSVALKRFGQTRFQGSMPTRSRGRATDFNLMFRTGADGFVEALRIPASGNQVITIQTTAYTHHGEVFYACDGEVAATFPDGETVVIREGGLLVVHCDNGDADAEILFAGLPTGSDAVVIRAVVFHNEIIPFV